MIKDHLDHGMSKVLMNPCPEIGFAVSFDTLILIYGPGDLRSLKS